MARHVVFVSCALRRVKYCWVADLTVSATSDKRRRRRRSGWRVPQSRRGGRAPQPNAAICHKYSATWGFREPSQRLRDRSPRPGGADLRGTPQARRSGRRHCQRPQSTADLGLQTTRGDASANRTERRCRRGLVGSYRAGYTQTTATCQLRRAHVPDQGAPMAIVPVAYDIPEDIRD